MVSPDGSSIGRAPISNVVPRFVDKPIEAASFNVSLELTIPVRRVKLGKPGAKHGSVFVEESFDSHFDFMNRTHWQRLQNSNLDYRSD
jgi:hypothetical protein